MQPAIDACVYIVDDDEGVRAALAWLLRSRGLSSTAFDSALAFEQLLQAGWEQLQPGCLLLDVRMPVMSGLALFDILLQRGLSRQLPVIFLTGHGDLATAVDAVKRGAFDFCEKPLSDNGLVDRVELAIAQSRASLAMQRACAALERRISELTSRERAVMHLVVEGLPNKLVADRLHISVRTVEVHRARVFDKMQVKSAVELAKLLQSR